MKVPSKIDPCPIVEAIMEVRFESSFDEAAVFGIIYNQIRGEFDKTEDLPVLQLPAAMRKSDPNLIFQPYYRLVSKKNKNSILQIGPRVFSVVITRDYPGWKDFLKEIDYGLSKLQESQVVSKVSRLGLRYLNFFDINILMQSNLFIELGDHSFNSNNAQLRIEIPDGNFLHALFINNDAKFQLGNEIKIGSIIDIDTSIQSEITDFFNQRSKLLDDCHRLEKTLFFSLLSDEYEKSLKEIKYE